jgi:hypothetical protein
MLFTTDLLGDTLKAVQIVFYTIGGILAFLTYRAAVRGWFTPTHTEYQRRVMDRLAKLSEDLYSEFNPASGDYLTGHHGLQEALTLIHKDFERSKDAILAIGEWDGWILLPRDTFRLEQILEPVRSDPFIPDSIRKVVIELLEHRLAVFSEVSNEQLVEYRNALASGKIEPNDRNWMPILNKINAEMAKQNCGPRQVETAVCEIRGLIQKYLDSFNPHGAKRRPRLQRSGEGSATREMQRRAS